MKENSQRLTGGDEKCWGKRVFLQGGMRFMGPLCCDRSNKITYSLDLFILSWHANICRIVSGDAGLACNHSNMLTVRILAAFRNICRFLCQVSCVLVSGVSVFNEFLKLVSSELKILLHFLENLMFVT